MNLYDFDDTIYDGDSCKDIVLFGLKKHPILTIKSLFRTFIYFIKYKSDKVPFEKVKESMLSFIFKIKNKEDFINSFVEEHIKKIKPWYKEKQTKNDIIVSASYEIWLNVFANKIGINYVIGTKTDEYGNIIGKNCKREEKVKRLNKEFKNKTFLNSYSDSSSDTPILKLAKNAFIVEGNKLILYNPNYKFKNNK